MKWIWILNIYVIIMLVCIDATAGDDVETTDSAHIVSSKFTLSHYAVEGMDYVIDYRLYNVGGKVCYTVLTVCNDWFTHKSNLRSKNGESCMDDKCEVHSFHRNLMSLI